MCSLKKTLRLRTVLQSRKPVGRRHRRAVTRLTFKEVSWTVSDSPKLLQSMTKEDTA